MTHDPMCPIVDRRYYSATCVCDLIARVRADEREKADCPDPSICDRHNCAAAAAYCDGVSDERERAAERVAAALAGQHKAEQYDYPREGQTTLYCRSCADLCHSETGLMCEFPHDGAWPCKGYENGLKLVAAARGGDA